MLQKTSNNPVDEYKDWHEREISLGMLVEQLKYPLITTVLNVLDRAGSLRAAAFTTMKNDVLHSYIEARDNDKFLSTVLRHFKVIILDNLSDIILATIFFFFTNYL